VCKFSRLPFFNDFIFREIKNWQGSSPVSSAKRIWKLAAAKWIWKLPRNDTEQNVHFRKSPLLLNVCNFYKDYISGLFIQPKM